MDEDFLICLHLSLGWMRKEEQRVLTDIQEGTTKWYLKKKGGILKDTLSPPYF